MSGCRRFGDRARAQLEGCAISLGVLVVLVAAGTGVSSVAATRPRASGVDGGCLVPGSVGRLARSGVPTCAPRSVTYVADRATSRLR